MLKLTTRRRHFDPPRRVTAAGVDRPVYRFLSFNPDVLKAGAPIALSWGVSGTPRKETSYRYEPPSRAE